MQTPPENDRSRPAGNGAASKLSDGDIVSLSETIDHFVKRLLTDCLNEATSRYWLKRAEDFERAKPRPDEFHGNAATPAKLNEQWRRLDDIARACRARAQVSPLDEIAAEVETIFEEAS